MAAEPTGTVPTEIPVFFLILQSSSLHWLDYGSDKLLLWFVDAALGIRATANPFGVLVVPRFLVFDILVFASLHPRSLSSCRNYTTFHPVCGGQFCGTSPDSPFARTGKPKPSYRETRTAVQGTRPTSAGKNAAAYRRTPNLGEGKQNLREGNRNPS